MRVAAAEAAAHCGQHKQPGEVDVANRRCEADNCHKVRPWPQLPRISPWCCFLLCNYVHVYKLCSWLSKVCVCLLLGGDIGVLCPLVTGGWLSFVHGPQANSSCTGRQWQHWLCLSQDVDSRFEVPMTSLKTNWTGVHGLYSCSKQPYAGCAGAGVQLPGRQPAAVLRGAQAGRHGQPAPRRQAPARGRRRASAARAGDPFLVSTA